MAQENQNKKNKRVSKARKYEDYEDCREPNVSMGGYFFGIMAILIGLVFLLYNLGLIKVSFNLWSLWPLILILIGLSVLNKKSTVSTFFGIFVILATIFIVSLAFLGPQYYLEKLTPKSKPQTQVNSTQTTVIPPQTTAVQLFYYNKANDPDITCAIVTSVNRDIVVTASPIKDTINLLLQGNLTDEEKAQGFTTEFPNSDFKLLNADLTDGTLTLTFTEVPRFTDGGACRTRILKNEILKTAEQFQGVNKVVLMPETLFQP